MSHEKPHPSFEPSEFVISILQLASIWRRRLDALSKRHGLTYQQYSVLTILHEAQAKGEGPLPTMTVAERMIEPEPGITRMMSRLERMGFVRRERSEDDARVSLCRISRKGQATLRRMEAPMKNLHRSLAGSLAGPRLKEMSTVVSQAASSIQSDMGPSQD